MSIKSPVSATESKLLENSKEKPNLSPQEKLEEINQKLADVRKKRLEFEQGEGKKRLSRQNTDEKPLRKSFHHPKLDFVIAEIVYSPYNTKPNESYSQETFRVPEKLSELKKRTSKLDDLPKEEQPFDMKEIKGRFLNEVANYNVSFVMPEEKSSASLRKSVMLRKSMTVNEGDSSTGIDLRASTSSLPKINRASVSSASSGKPSKGKKSSTLKVAGMADIASPIEHALVAVNREFEDIRGELAKAESERILSMSPANSEKKERTREGAPETVNSTSSKSELPPDNIYIPRLSPRLEPISRPNSSRNGLISPLPLNSLSAKSLPVLSTPRSDALGANSSKTNDLMIAAPLPSSLRQLEAPAKPSDDGENDYEGDFEPKETIKPQKEAQVHDEEQYEDDTEFLAPIHPTIEKQDKENYEEDVFNEHEEVKENIPSFLQEINPGVSTVAKDSTNEEEYVEDDYEGGGARRREFEDDATKTTAEDNYYGEDKKYDDGDTANRQPFSMKSNPSETEETYISSIQTKPLYSEEYEDPDLNSVSAEQSEKHFEDFRSLYPEKYDNFDEHDPSLYPYGENRNIQEIQTAVINSSDFEALVLSFGQMAHIMR